MRIAYISLHWPRTVTTGVGKKIRQQISTWQALGHDARFFMHTHPHNPASDLLDGEHFIYEKKNLMQTELNRIRASSKLVASVRAFRPDIIYLRYGMYVYPVHQLAVIAPIVEEINTNDLTQQEDLGKIFSLYNRYTRGILLKRMNALITVSRELAVEPAFSSYKKVTEVIANGIDLNAVQPLPAPQNDVPRLLFIGSPGFSWHGVDKLIQLAAALPEFQIDIVGYDKLSGYGPLPANLNLHGYLNSKEYLAVMAKADVAISSLALHRIGLEEASPLKSRECLAYGLPMILAYIDTDLHDMDCDFLLQIPNAEDNIQSHKDVIRDFVYRMRGKRAERAKIAPIDQQYKETKRLAFFEKIIAESRS